MDRLLAGFSASGRRPAGRLRPTTYQPPSAEEIVRRLDVVAKARRNGAAGLPETGATQFDGPQQEVVQFVEGAIRENTAEIERTLLGLRQRLDRIRSLDASRLARLGAEFREALDAVRRELEADLLAATAAAAALEREFGAFRARHGLTRAPDYPESKTLYVGVLVALVLGEGVVNTYFFRHGTDLGILGGAFQAFLLAAIDVFVIFQLGLASRYLAHARLPGRLFGAATGAAGLAWAATYNLAVAHYREQLLVVPREATRAAVASFTRTPLGLQDGESWLLFALGVVFSVLAFADGRAFDDAYPGYGRLHRRLDAARDDLAECRDALLTAATACWKEHTERAKSLAAEAERALADFRHTRETRDKLRGDLASYVTLCEEACNAVIRTYRDENRLARSTPAPAYFDEAWRYPVARPEPRAGADGERPGAEEIESRLAGMGAARDAALADIDAAFAQARAGWERRPPGDA